MNARDSLLALCIAALASGLAGCAPAAPRQLRMEADPAREMLAFPRAPEVPRYRHEGTLIGEVNYRAPGENGRPGWQRALAWVAGLGEGGPPPDELLRPTAGAADGCGRVVVADPGRAGVFAFPREGNLEVFEFARGNRRFASPAGIACGEGGSIFVSDSALKVVVEAIFRPNFGGAALREMTYWYAPEVRRVVRYTSVTRGTGNYLSDPNVDYELVAYQLDGGKSAGTIDPTLASAASPGGASAPVLVASASPTRGVVQMQGPAIPKVGDRWEYQTRDLSNNRITGQRIDVGSVGPDGILENVAIDGGGSVTLQHGAGAYLTGAGLVQFSPYLQAFGALEASAFSGEIGVTRLADCEGVRSCTVKARVLGKERVTVPAGTFDATKVEVTVVVAPRTESCAMPR